MNRRDDPTDLQYSIVIENAELNKIIEAINWCHLHNGYGEFAVTFGLVQSTEDDRSLVGKYYFDNKEDFAFFCLKWC